jgi:hypothetical protein
LEIFYYIKIRGFFTVTFLEKNTDFGLKAEALKYLWNLKMYLADASYAGDEVRRYYMKIK